MREKILELLRQQPFQPFRLHLSNGVEYLVRHPEQVMVGPSFLIVGIPVNGGPGPEVTDTAFVSLLRVVQATTVKAASPPAAAG